MPAKVFKKQKKGGVCMTLAAFQAIMYGSMLTIWGVLTIQLVAKEKEKREQKKEEKMKD